MEGRKKKKRKSFLDGKHLQPPGSAACDICLPHSEQISHSTADHRYTENKMQSKAGPVSFLTLLHT